MKCWIVKTDSDKRQMSDHARSIVSLRLRTAPYSLRGNELKELKLDTFGLLDRQPKMPHRRREVARYQDEFGITYAVASNWPRNAWFVYASKDGYRMANTKQTRSPSVAAQWIAAVEQGRVRIADSTS